MLYKLDSLNNFTKFIYNLVCYVCICLLQKSKTSIDENWCSVIVGIVNTITVLVSAALIDRLGRKILLYTSSTIMAITITSTGIYLYYIEHFENQIDLRWIPLVSMILYIIGFSIGFGPIPWLMMGEILPGKQVYNNKCQ